MIHEISKIRAITEVSIVTYPAYPSTEVSTRQKRSLENDKKELDNFFRLEREVQILREKINLMR